MNIIEDGTALLEDLLNTSTAVSENKCREVLIVLLNSKTLPAQLLLEPIELLRKANPNIFKVYQFDDVIPAVSNIEIEWTSDYFDEYKVSLESNFSYERYEHLIRVKSSLERDGVKGFGIKLNQVKKNISTAPLQETITMKPLPSNYLPPENLKDSVNKGNLVYIRSAIIALLTNNNVQWLELEHAFIWTLNQCPSLFDEHIEANYAKAINPNNVAWAADYYFEHEVYLNANFSEIRWLHLLSVRKLLASKNIKGFVRNTTQNRNKPTNSKIGTSNIRSESANQQRNTTSLESDKLRIMLMIGGAIAILAALIFAMIG